MIEKEFNGYLRPYVPYIYALHKYGIKPSVIADLLFEAGARSLYYYDDDRSRDREVCVLSASVRYLVYKRDPCGLPVLSRVYKDKQRQQHARSPANRTRPIDMGGRRDYWHEWTPEKQYREFQ